MSKLIETVKQCKGEGMTYQETADRLNGLGYTTTAGNEWTRDAARNFYRRVVNPEKSDRASQAAAALEGFARGASEAASGFYEVGAVTASGLGSCYTEVITRPQAKKPVLEQAIADYRLSDAGNVLVIPDIHEPFSLDGFAEWTKEQFIRWGIDTVVFIGDIVDNYATSVYPKDVDNPSVLHEYERASERLGVWLEMYTDAVLTLGNHDDRPQRTAKAGGVSSVFMRSFRDTWGIPDGWTICQRAIIDGVVYTHQGGGRPAPSLSLAKSLLAPCVTGHYHTVGGVRYHNGLDVQLWGLDVGCGVDQTSYGMAYNKSLSGYVHGCGVVINENGKPTPLFIPFNG